MAADSANLALSPWRGFHHVALVTRDLDANMRFYAEALGIEIMADDRLAHRHLDLLLDGLRAIRDQSVTPLPGSALTLADLRAMFNGRTRAPAPTVSEDL
jgi:catechol 2,3-dioxygenase-like lactoylglutathione lyase family enzyme